jgi:hypothetical protein
LFPKGKLFLIFHYIRLKIVENFLAKNGWFSQFTNLVQFGKIEHQFLAGWAMNSAAQAPIRAHATVQNATEAHRSVTQGRGTRRAPQSSRSDNIGRGEDTLRSPPTSHHLAPSLSDSSCMANLHFLALHLP